MTRVSRRRALQAVAGGTVGTLTGCLDRLSLGGGSNDGIAIDGAWTEHWGDRRNTLTTQAATIPDEPPSYDWGFGRRDVLDDREYFERRVDSLGVVLAGGTLHTALLRSRTASSSTDTETNTPTGAAERSTDDSFERDHAVVLDVFALDAGSGAVEWRTEVDIEPPAVTYRGPIAIDTERLHLAVTEGDSSTLVSFDREDGSVSHRGAPLFGGLTVGEQRLYGRGADPSTEELAYLGVDPSSGEVEWSVTVPEGYSFGRWLTVESGRLITSLPWGEGSENSRRFLAWSLDDGERAWTSDPLPASGGVGPHAVASDTVVASGRSGLDRSSAGGTVVALDATDGSRRFTREFDRNVGTKTVVDGTVLVLTASPFDEGDDDARHVEALDLGDGSVRYSERVPGLLGRPVSDGERVLFPGPSPTVIEASDGATVWQTTTEDSPAGTTTSEADDPARDEMQSLAGFRTVVPGDEHLFCLDGGSMGGVAVHGFAAQ